MKILFWSIRKIIWLKLKDFILIIGYCKNKYLKQNAFLKNCNMAHFISETLIHFKVKLWNIHSNNIYFFKIKIVFSILNTAIKVKKILAIIKI